MNSRSWFDSVFSTTKYKQPIERRQAQMTYGITMILMVLYTVYIVFVPSTADSDLTYVQQLPDRALEYAILYVVGVLTIVFTRAGYVERAAWGPLVMWVFGVLLNSVDSGYVDAINGVLLVWPLLFGGLLLEQRGLWVGYAVSMVILTWGISTRGELPAVEAIGENTVDLVILALQLSGGAAIIHLFLRFAHLGRMTGASEVLTGRNLTTNVLSNIAELVAQRVSRDELLTAIVEQICDRFDYIYHAQVFLVNQYGDAELVASTGEVGKQLLNRRHSLRVGSTSVIGQVTLRGQVVIAYSNRKDSVHRRNELLQDTAVEAAFPLRLGDRVIGALDVQSTQMQAFDDPNLQAMLEAMADSIALAIDNVAQFQAVSTQLAENERLVEETRKALYEVERLNERLTGQAWQEFLRDRPQGYGYSVDFQDGDAHPDIAVTRFMQDAMAINHLVQEEQNDQQIIAVPLRIRGRVVGAMEFELDPERAFTPEDFDLVQEVGQRFGMAVENVRLVEQSQQIAQREALVNQITTRMQTPNNVDGMLKEVAQSLFDVLKADRVAIQLGTPPDAEAQQEATEQQNGSHGS